MSSNSILQGIIIHYKKLLNIQLLILKKPPSLLKYYQNFGQKHALNTDFLITYIARRSNIYRTQTSLQTQLAKELPASDEMTYQLFSSSLFSLQYMPNFLSNDATNT